MPLAVRSPRLFVLRWSVTDQTGTHRASWHMPAAPFGQPAWQLPTVAAHLARLYRTGAPPTVDAFAAHLARWAGGRVPIPEVPYGYDPLHDPRVACWIDAHVEPAGPGEQWPRCSLVILQQECGRCSWSRITRHRGAYGVIAHTHAEATAEVQRLSDLLRTHPAPSLVTLRDMAADLQGWAQRLHRQAKAEQTLIKAGKAAAPRRPARRSIRVHTRFDDAPASTPALKRDMILSVGLVRPQPAPKPHASEGAHP